MLEQKTKDDFSMKLKHLINTPSDTRSFYDDYQAEHEEVSFNQYMDKVEELIDQLQEDHFEDQQSFCQKIRSLKIADDQFGC